MTKSIFLAASMSFYPELIEIEKQLADRGYTVQIPFSAVEMKKTGNYDPTAYKGSKTFGERAVIIRDNFDKIVKCDALLVINNTKNGVEGYIGPNVLMEIALAFHHHKKIFIWNPYPEDAPYQEELLCFGTVVIEQNLHKIAI